MNNKKYRLVMSPNNLKRVYKNTTTIRPEQWGLSWTSLNVQWGSSWTSLNISRGLLPGPVQAGPCTGGSRAWSLWKEGWGQGHVQKGARARALYRDLLWTEWLTDRHNWKLYFATPLTGSRNTTHNKRRQILLTYLSKLPAINTLLSRFGL